MRLVINQDRGKFPQDVLPNDALAVLQDVGVAEHDARWVLVRGLEMVSVEPQTDTSGKRKAHIRPGIEQESGFLFVECRAKEDQPGVRLKRNAVVHGCADAAPASSATKMQSVPKVYPTRANLAVAAAGAERKISNLRAFNGHREFPSHPGFFSLCPQMLK